MLKTTSKTFIAANRLAIKNINNLLKNSDYAPLAVCHLYTSAARHNNVAIDPILPIPNNVDAAETTRFSPQRSRDISDMVMTSQAPISTIDITADNTLTALNNNTSGYGAQDPHVQSYDCFGAVSLNSVMQSNVPQPFAGMHKFSHLNMPGGQWSQDYKFMSQNLQSSHYRNLRDALRADWAAYDQNATLSNKELLASVLSSPHINYIGITCLSKRSYSTQPKAKSTSSTATEAEQKSQISTAAAATANDPTEGLDTKVLSKKEQLKLAFKHYGATIILFHVAISLVSLGGFYLIVSNGVNVMSVMEFLGISKTTMADSIASGSTFVVAYAVHKVFAPVRISITLGSAPFIVRYFRSKGFLKAKDKASSLK